MIPVKIVYLLMSHHIAKPVDVCPDVRANIDRRMQHTHKTGRFEFIHPINRKLPVKLRHPSPVLHIPYPVALV